MLHFVEYDVPDIGLIPWTAARRWSLVIQSFQLPTKESLAFFLVIRTVPTVLRVFGVASIQKPTALAAAIDSTGNQSLLRATSAAGYQSTASRRLAYLRRLIGVEQALKHSLPSFQWIKEISKDHLHFLPCTPFSVLDPIQFPDAFIFEPSAASQNILFP